MFKKRAKGGKRSGLSNEVTEKSQAKTEAPNEGVFSNDNSSKE